METLISLFREAAKKYAGRTAVVFEDKQLSYGQVDEMTDSVASVIADRLPAELPKEPVISILIHRNEWMVLAPIAALKAGCGYQPLDPDYPQDRLNFMISDASCSLLICDRELRDLLSDYNGPVVFTDEVFPDTAEIKEDGLVPSSRLILLYTSGSTGIPKGVELEHRNVLAYTRWYQKTYGLSCNSRIAAYASFGFDANMMDLYPTLLSGAAMYIVPENIRTDLIALGDFFEKNGITAAFMTTQVAEQFAQTYDKIGALEHLTAGGEKFRSMELPSGYKMHNIYGPTECSVAITHKLVEVNEPDIPIGKPTDNTVIHIVDKDLNEVEPGGEGELLVAGPQVGRAYLNRPDKTAEAFIDFKGERCYRTGDIVKMREDGDLVFVGRKDGQVKIRGFRVELKEIEAVIREYPEVLDATVQAFEYPDGGKYLVAYVVGSKEIDSAELNSFIGKTKPPYMVPAYTMQIESIPLNINQKVDVKSLPRPDTSSGETKTEGAPLNHLEEAIAEIIASVIYNKEFGLTDRLAFFGLNSISGIRLATLIYKRFGVALDSKELLKTGSLQSIENTILDSMLNGDAAGTKVAADEVKAEAPSKAHLSFPQQGVYAECLASPESTRYNLPICLKMPDGVTADQLEKAVRTVVAAHPYLFCHFVTGDNDETIQEPTGNTVLEIPYLEIPASKFDKHKKEFVQPFNLSEGPLMRFEIIESGSLQLLMDFHHLIADGSSIDLFTGQLCEALDGAEIEAESYTYYNFVADEAPIEENEQYFDNLMGNFEEATMLIPDIFEKDLPHSIGSVHIPADLEKIEKYASSLGITPGAVYLAAAFIAASRFVCEDNVSIATISGGRSNLRISNTMGMFVNTLPLVSSMDLAESADDYAKRVADMFEETIRHEAYPFARIASRYDFKPAISFANQIGVLNDYTIKQGKVEIIEDTALDMAKLPIAIFINGSQEKGGSIDLEYDQSLYSEAMMKNFAQAIDAAATALAKGTAPKDISLTGKAQWNLLDSFNPEINLTTSPEDTVVSIFRRRAAEDPSHIAIVFKDKTLTYKEVDEITDRCAKLVYEKTRGTQPLTNGTDRTVSILIHRHEWMVLASLAALKAGCGYQPLDPSYPRERLNFMVKDASACLLITDDDLADVIDEYEGERLLISELAAAPESGAPLTPHEGLRPSGLATMLYTSGSTGLPKGCMIEHGSLTVFAEAYRDCWGIDNDSRIAAYASFGFDVNMMDMYCTLQNGATLVIIPEDMRMNLDELHDYMEKTGVNLIFMTTQVGVQYLENYPQSSCLKTVAMGGEKLRAVSPENLSYHIFNGYGPSETTCGCSLFRIDKWEPNIPIGRPIKSMNVYIVDKSGHRLPPGAAGELWIAGPQVARGYLNRPEKNAEAFADNPFGPGRIYHSGDIVRYRENGDIEFVGRKDSQVKIRGFRIELKEVESVIREFEGIKDVTVQAYDYDDGGKYLAAFVVSDTKVDIEALEAFIKSQKPPYMVPAVTMQLDAIPLTVNQKVDKKALPKPVAQKAAFVAPEGKIEEDFCNIFKNILSLEKVSAEDDFFEIGGSSILAMKVVVAAGKAGYEIVYNDVFSHTTPRAIAAFLGEDHSQETHEEAPVEVSGNSVYGYNVVETGLDGFDYAPLNALLRGNTLEAFENGEKQPVKDVLLAGATGFLGVHVLRELICSDPDRHIWCFVRSKGGKSGEEHLKETLHFYYGDIYDSLIGSRVEIVEGDATDPKALKGFKPPKGDVQITAINCAASVKHFSATGEIEKINVESVKNLISWCLSTGSRLVHVSTESVFGSSRGNLPSKDFKFDEHILFAGQIIDENQYVHSKFTAERIIYDAVLHHGLNAKVCRVGNLAPRFEDGGVQINYDTNNILCLLRAYMDLGKISYSMLDEIIEFSPIEFVAKAIVSLASTPRECVCFMPSNQHIILMGDVLRHVAEACGKKLETVEDGQLSDAIGEAIADAARQDKMRPLMAYARGAADSDIRDNSIGSFTVEYTMQILFRLGFSWPETDKEYFRRFVERLSGYGFFD
jgi:amino acid adenylation domain